MPLKKVDSYSSKMTYAVYWSYPHLVFHENDFVRYPNSMSYWALSYTALGVRNTKKGLELTYGRLLGVVIDSEEDVSSRAWQNLMDTFINLYDTRHGIGWEAKLSGKDDIKLANSNSFDSYLYYWSMLAEYRREISNGSTPELFTGWYQNA